MEAVHGKKIIHKYRIFGDNTAAYMLAFVTENGRSFSVDADSTATKDGSLRTPGTPEMEITSTSILPKGDEKIDAIEDAGLAGTMFEIWEINLDEPATGQNKYKGKYFQGYLTEFEKEDNADDFTQITLTFGVNGTGKRGSCTVTDAEISAADYVFTDTVASA